MSNAISSRTNLVDADIASLSASDTAGDLAIQNVQDPRMTVRYRTTSLTPTLQIDFGTNSAVQALAIRFARDTTFATSGTVRHRLDTAAGSFGGGGQLDTGTIAINTTEGYGYHLYFNPTEVSARYWQVDLDVSGVSFIDIVRLWAGSVFQPSPNIAYGYEDSFEDTSRVTEAEVTGTVFVDEGNILRRYKVGLDAMSEADRDQARELKRIAGLHQQVLFCLNPDNPSQETVIGRLTEARAITHPNPAVYRTELSIRESA